MREIGIAVAGLMALALVLQSCRASHYSDQVDAMRDSHAIARGQAASCAAALKGANDITAEAEALAASTEQAWQEAARAAAQTAREASARERAAQRALDEARRDPTCAEQLEVKLCAAIPLL